MSTFTIVNNTDETVRCALYCKPLLRPTLSSVAWRIVAPPPKGGQTVVVIPGNYSVYANYSSDPTERQNPHGGSRTNVVTFDQYAARFCVVPIVSQDNREGVATIVQSFDGVVMNETRIENHFGYGVWGHITKDGTDVFAPQVVWPGGVLMEDLRATFYVAVVSQFVYQGYRLVGAEAQLTETPIVEGGTLTVTGSVWTGYALQ